VTLVYAGLQLPPEARRVTGARAIALALALLLGGCAGAGMTIDKEAAALPDPPKTAAAPAAAPVEMDAAAQREHERILAAYNGVYENPQIEAMVSQTVEKLVAASDRPDLHYRITLLNSPVVNAFALPSGQLYVTRGLVALANDSSELASVMAHEMSHVIAHHAEIREDRARQVALVNRMVANGVLSDPDVGALALAKSKIALASFSRAQEFDADAMGVGIAARAGFDPYGGALPHLARP
jgi:predicted Zn-dependent protease